MIPILFAPNATEYGNNGLGALCDCTACTVTENRNGSFELEMKYPVTGLHFSEICCDGQILVKPNLRAKPQAFRVYSISKPLNGLVTINAEHISYQLSSVIVKPFSANNPTDIFAKLKENAIGENPFEFWTDKKSKLKVETTIPTSCRSILGGIDGSILDVYGGEYEFDNHTVKLHQSRGSDTSFEIAYRKNLTGVTCTEKLDGVVTGALAYWSKEIDGVAQMVYGDLQTVENSLSFDRIVTVDCSSDFDKCPVKEDLNTAAKKYLEAHKNAPYFSVSVEFVHLGGSAEYAQYKKLYDVGLCDTVTVKYPEYGIFVKSKVIKAVFDVLKERYTKLEIGEPVSNIATTISAQQKDIVEKVTQTQLDKAVLDATNAITGNKGGYVVLNPPTQPQELLVLDKPNISEAINVWRFNLAGFGHSSNGYNGIYSTAITQDGKIVADFITSGTLNADLITVKNLSANSIKGGLLTSQNNLSSFNLNNGVIVVGGKTYNTKILQGGLEQHYGSDDALVGGVVPIGSGNNIFQGLYYNSGFAKGISILRRSSSGDFFALMEFYSDKIESKVEFSSKKISTQDIFSKENITNTAESITNTASEFFNVEASTICFGKAFTKEADSKILFSGNTFADGDIYSTGTISGSSIVNYSERKGKKNIRSSNCKSVVSALKSLKLYDYALKNSGKCVKLGLMVDEAPEEILSDDGKGINLYSYCGLLAATVKELCERIERLEEKNG